MHFSINLFSFCYFAVLARLSEGGVSETLVKSNLSEGGVNLHKKNTWIYICTHQTTKHKTMTKTETASLYVGTYQKYNSGSINGQWVDLSQFSSAKDFLTYCAELHADEEDPEFMFQDFEGFPRSLYSESMSADELEKLIEFANLDDDDKLMIEMYAEATGYGLEDVTLSEAQDAFHGTADSEAEFTQRMAEEGGCIPKDLPTWIEYAIDWESAWNCSLRHDYNTATDKDGTIYFFLQC